MPRLIDPPSIGGHNDITGQNVIILDDAPVGLVDFDLAGRGETLTRSLLEPAP